MYADEPGSTLLRRALKTNAVLSAVSGILLVGGAKLVGPLIGFDLPALYVALGAGLIAFAYWVWRGAGRAKINRREARIVLWLDIVWVLDSALLLLGFPEFFTAIGIAAIAVVAVMVAAFALAEYAGIRRLAGQAGN